jgi:hypothetical protein
MASAAEMCTFKVQEKSGILKKNPEILKENKAPLLILHSREADTVVNEPSTGRRARVSYSQEKYR